MVREMLMEHFETILGEAMRATRRTAVRVLGRHREDVDDVLQNAAIKAWRFREDFRGTAQFRTYFCRIVINEALMHMRKEASRPHESLEEKLGTESGELVKEPSDGAPSPEQWAYAAEIMAAVESGLRQMPPVTRTEGQLLILGDMGTKDNARKARRFRARKILQRVLKERGIYVT